MEWYYYLALIGAGLIVLVYLILYQNKNIPLYEKREKFHKKFNKINSKIPGLNKIEIFESPQELTPIQKIELKKARPFARKEYYTNTKLNERLEDEKTTDRYAKNGGEWQKNIRNLDYPGIDDKLPDGYLIKKTKGITRGSYTDNIKSYTEYKFSLFTDKGDLIGYIEIVDNDKKKETDIEYGFIESDYRGKGLYPYLRREVINHVDSKKHAMATSASGDSQFSKEAKQDHYMSYGKAGKRWMAYVPELDMIVRRPNEAPKQNGGKKK